MNEEMSPTSFSLSIECEPRSVLDSFAGRCAPPARAARVRDPQEAVLGEGGVLLADSEAGEVLAPEGLQGVCVGHGPAIVACDACRITWAGRRCVPRLTSSRRPG